MNSNSSNFPNRSISFSQTDSILSSWTQLVANSPNQLAIFDCASNKKWSILDFQQRAIHHHPEKNSLNEWVAPSGSGVDFLTSLLWAVINGKKLALTDHPERDCPDHSLNIPPEKLPENAFLIKRTSGTSGSPRWVVFSERQILADVEQIVTTMGLRRDCPNYSILSLAHSYGFSNLALPLLVHGIPLILGSSPLPGSVYKDLETHNGCVVPAVPAIWRSWFDAEILPALSDKIKVAISAGAPLDLELEKEVFEKTGIKIHNFYGSSECGGIAYDASATPRLSSGFIGTQMPNVQVEPDPDSGRICVTGSTVGMTYWPEANQDLSNGVFRTGDLGKVEAGMVILTGRASDRINIAGRKVAPELVEAALNSLDSVEQSLVFGIPSTDTKRGDEIVAVVRLKSGSNEQELNVKQVRSQLSQKLRTWEMPRTVWIHNDLRPNQRGKLSRHDWKMRYLEREL